MVVQSHDLPSQDWFPCGFTPEARTSSKQTQSLLKLYSIWPTAWCCFFIWITVQHLQTGSFHLNTQMPSFFLRSWELRQVYLLPSSPLDRGWGLPVLQCPWLTSTIYLLYFHSNLHHDTCLSPAAIGDTFSDCSNTFLSGFHIPNMFGSCLLAIGNNAADFQNNELFPGISWPFKRAFSL